MKAATSLPRNISPSPTPTTSGELRRAATTVSGCSASTQDEGERAGAGGGTRRAARRRASRPRCRGAGPTRCATVSVSVSLANSTPSLSSSARRAAKFSMMPLWTTATRPRASVCGWALTSVGAPWVAQRVWPMPVLPPRSRGGEFLVQVLDPAGLLRDLQALRADERHAGRVVAPVLQPPQTLDHDVQRRAGADVANDAAHADQPKASGNRTNSARLRCSGWPRASSACWTRRKPGSWWWSPGSRCACTWASSRPPSA